MGFWLGALFGACAIILIGIAGFGVFVHTLDDED